MQATASQLPNSWSNMMWPADSHNSSGIGGISHDFGIDDHETDSLISMSLSMFEEDLFFGLGPMDTPTGLSSSSFQKHFDLQSAITGMPGAGDEEDDDVDVDDVVDQFLLQSQLADELFADDDDMIDPVMQEVEAAIEAGDLNSLIDQFEQSEKTIQQLLCGSGSTGSSASASACNESSILFHEGEEKKQKQDDVSLMPQQAVRKPASSSKKPAAAVSSSKTCTANRSANPAVISARNKIAAIDANNNSPAVRNKNRGNKAKAGSVVKKSKKKFRSTDGMSLLAKPNSATTASICKKVMTTTSSSALKQQPSNALTCSTNLLQVVNRNTITAGQIRAVTAAAAANGHQITGQIRCQNYSKTSSSSPSVVTFVTSSGSGSDKKNNTIPSISSSSSPIVIMDRKLLTSNANRLNAGTSIVLTGVPANSSSNSKNVCLRLASAPCSVSSVTSSSSSSLRSSSSSSTSSSSSIRSAQMIRIPNATVASDGTSSGSSSGGHVQDHDYCPVSEIECIIDSSGSGASDSCPIVLN
jgi:hypothetical protein